MVCAVLQCEHHGQRDEDDGEVCTEPGNCRGGESAAATGGETANRSTSLSAPARVRPALRHGGIGRVWPEPLLPSIFPNL